MFRRGRYGKHVCIVVQNLPVPFDRRVWAECRALRAAGYEVSVVCPKGKDDPSYAELEGVHLYKYRAFPPITRQVMFVAEYVYSILATFVHLVRAWRRRPFSVVQVCNPPDVLWAAAFPFQVLFGVKLVYDQHDLCPELYLSRFDRGQDLLYRGVCALERATYRAADVVISTNESYKQVARIRGGKKPEDVFVVRSAPVVERFHEVPAEPELKKGKPYLLAYLGVMGPQDGVDYALRALAKLRDEIGRTDWHAVFVGSGDAFDDMVELSAKLGLANQVEFTGRISDEDLVRYLSTADVCLSPDPLNPLNDVSTMNKVMEYMAMSKPIVSFELREARVSAGDAAVYAPANDESAFAKLVAQLLDDPEERARMGKLGQARVAGPLSWENSAKALLAAYEHAVKS